jgi:hypothetical protein
LLLPVGCGDDTTTDTDTGTTGTSTTTDTDADGATDATDDAPTDDTTK